MQVNNDLLATCVLGKPNLKGQDNYYFLSKVSSTFDHSYLTVHAGQKKGYILSAGYLKNIYILKRILDWVMKKLKPLIQRLVNLGLIWNAYTFTKIKVSGQLHFSDEVK